MKNELNFLQEKYESKNEVYAGSPFKGGPFL